MEATYITPGVSLSAANTFSGQIGIGAAANTSGMDSTVPFFISRTSSNTSGVSLGQHVLYSLAHTNLQVITAALFDVVNTGSNPIGAGHILGIIGRVQDTSTGQSQMYGVEGKTIRSGTNDSDAAFFGLSDYNGTTYTGRQRNVFYGFGEIYNGTTATPVNQGAICVFKAVNGVGGDPTLRFALQGDLGMMITTGGSIGSYDAASGTKYLQIAHDGTDSRITSSTGNLRIYTGTGNYVVIQDGDGFAPGAEGKLLGIDSYRWGLIKATSFNIGPTATPGTSVTRIKHGVTSAMTAGSITVSETTTTANSRIYLTHKTAGGTPGWLRVSARSAGTSFTITSSSGTDTSTVDWLMIEP